MRAYRQAVFAVFFLSGAVGLVYEVAWLRMFRLAMGNTVYTSAMVLTAFMAGLALGSLLIGRIADRLRHPLRVYALIEGGIGAYALILPYLMPPVDPAYGWLYGRFGDAPVALAMGRFLISFLLLLGPSTLMGATLPLVSRGVTAGLEWIGRDVGRLYGVNTLGAAAGALLAGFALIPHAGVSGTILLAAFANVFICAAALWLDRGAVVLTAGTTSLRSGNVGSRSRLQLAVLGAVAGAGFASMVYEVAWTRALALLIGSSVYAFTLMLGAFIAGLGSGTVVVSGWIDRRRDPVLFLGGVQLVVALAALAVVPLFQFLPMFVVNMVTRYAGSFAALHALEFSTVFALMLVPTFCMGAVFPTVARMYTLDFTRLGRSVGEAYAANTLGSVAGSFTAGFVLIPMIGSRAAILVAVAINTAIGVGFWVTAVKHRRRVWLAPAAALLMLLGVVAWRAPRWDTLLFTSAPYLYAYKYDTSGVSDWAELQDAMTRNRELLYEEEGLTATVTVVKSDGQLYLKVNGKTDASSRGDLRSQSLLSHLPLIQCEHPRSALLIGLGSGISLGALEQHPVEHIECVEISPEVVEAASYFSDVNGDALADDRVQLIIGDGRNHVAYSTQMYDAIISQPSNLWIAGMADLFTREFFQSCRHRLAPDGIMCTWVQAYAMRAVDFRTVVRTFISVFPDAVLWESVPGGDYFLIGRMRPEPILPEVWRTRVAHRGLRPDLERIGVGSVDNMLCSYVAGAKGLARFANGVSVNTDDNARLEFSSPRGLYQGLVGQPGLFWAETLDPYRERPGYAVDDSVLVRGLAARRFAIQSKVAMDRHRYGEAVSWLEQATARNSDDMEVRRLWPKLGRELGARLASRDRHRDALALYHRALEVVPGRADLHLRAGTAHEHLHEYQRALAEYRMAHNADPQNVPAALRLAGTSARLGMLERAEQVYRDAARVDPQNADVYNEWGKSLLRAAQWERAIQVFGRGIEARPLDARLVNNMGVAYSQADELQAAVQCYRRAIVLSPDYARAHNNLGDALRRLGKTALAREAFNQALRHDPGNQRAQRALAGLSGS